MRDLRNWETLADNETYLRKVKKQISAINRSFQVSARKLNKMQIPHLRIL
jgi:hypothetical protein